MLRGGAAGAWMTKLIIIKTQATNYELQEVSWHAHIDYDLSGSVPLRISPGRFHVSTASRRQAFSTPNCNLVCTYLVLLPAHGYELFNLRNQQLAVMLD
jgi:hypothetical protein